MKFEEIIGNGEIKTSLTNIINQNKLSHSYLFTGIQGIRQIFNCKRMGKNDIV